MKTIEQLIKQLCDGDKNSKLRSKVNVKSIDLWYKRNNKKQLTK